LAALDFSQDDEPLPTYNKVVEVSEIKQSKGSLLEGVPADPAEEVLRKPGVIQVYKDAGDKFRFRVKASNGEIVGHGEGYNQKSSCLNGIKALTKAVAAAETADGTKAELKIAIGTPVIEIYRDAELKYRFRVRSANSEIILASQGYQTKDNCLKGIKSIRNIAENFTLKDDTKI